MLLQPRQVMLQPQQAQTGTTHYRSCYSLQQAVHPEHL